MGLRPVQMAGRLGLTLTEYRALEAGELHIDYDLYRRIVVLLRLAALAASGVWRSYEVAAPWSLRLHLVTQSSVVALGPATLSLAALFAALAFPLLVALLVPRFRRGLSEWAVDLDRPRIAVDVLLKAVTIVSVFAATNLFAFRADLEEILHCFNEVDVDRVALTYQGADLPPDVVEAFDNWTARRAATPFSQASVSPVSCVGIDTD